MPDDQESPASGKPGAAGDADAAPAHPNYVDPQGRKIWPKHRRQALRRARRMGLSPEDGNHALHLLAERGLDVFAADDNLLEIARAQAKAETEAPDVAPAAAVASSTALAKRPEGKGAVAPAKSPAPAKPKPKAEPDREAEILKIQNSLVRRRRMRLIGLLFRLAVFVAAPTALVSYYFIAIATEMYETESAFVIQTADSASAIPGLGGLFGNTSFATSQDSIVVQEYLTSREAFLQLDAELGYAAHFKDPEIDAIQRLHADASSDEAYRLFKNNVTIGFDPSEGLIRMSVIATTPAASQAFSEALVRYAEARVDGLTQEARGDQMDEAARTFREAEQKMEEAQQRVVDLQQRLNVLNPEAEFNLQMTIIAGLEQRVEELRVELAEQLDNPNPNETRVVLLQRELDLRRARIGDLRSSLTQTDDDTLSLARIIAEKSVADTELATRQALLQQSLQQMETARIEANRQVRYLSLAAAPVAPLEATHPRRLENSVLAFLLFGALYIFVSLTLSILREQISV